MTDIVPTIEERDNGSTQVVSWLALTSADSAGVPLKLRFTPWGDMTVQIIGTPGGATIRMEGSNDGTNWAILNDVSNTAISTTTAGTGDLYAIEQVPLYIRPNLPSGATGTTDIDIIMVMRRSNNSRT